MEDIKILFNLWLSTWYLQISIWMHLIELGICNWRACLIKVTFKLLQYSTAPNVLTPYSKNPQTFKIEFKTVLLWCRPKKQAALSFQCLLEYSDAHYSAANQIWLRNIKVSEYGWYSLYTSANLSYALIVIPTFWGYEGLLMVNFSAS